VGDFSAALLCAGTRTPSAIAGSKLAENRTIRAIRASSGQREVFINIIIAKSTL
jgi:hypothetical protein